MRGRRVNLRLEPLSAQLALELAVRGVVGGQLPPAIADLVPLVGENRALVHYGLRVLRKSPRLGLRSLFARTRTRQSELAEDDVAFLLAPRINAASRMGEPELAFQLLVTQDARQAETLANPCLTACWRSEMLEV